jgi:hypothetical protein
MNLPEPVLAAVNTIDGLIGHYAFTQAQEVAESTHAALITIEEGL